MSTSRIVNALQKQSGAAGLMGYIPDANPQVVAVTATSANVVGAIGNRDRVIDVGNTHATIACFFAFGTDAELDKGIMLPAGEVRRIELPAGISLRVIASAAVNMAFQVWDRDV